MVDGLFLVTANGVDQFDQFAVEDGGGVTDQLFLSLFASGRRRLGISCQGLDRAGLGLDAVGVDGGQQIADNAGELYAAGLLPDALLLLGIELPV